MILQVQMFLGHVLIIKLLYYYMVEKDGQQEIQLLLHLPQLMVVDFRNDLTQEVVIHVIFILIIQILLLK